MPERIYLDNLSEITAYFSDRLSTVNKTKTLEKQLLKKIYSNGRGWVFSKKDFTHLGDPASIDRTLSRMAEKSSVRRVMRGLYDYPTYSRLLKKNLSPDINQVAHALARKFGWNIQISGNAALNILGLSTQIPTQYQYLSDGPSKTYKVGNIDVQFKKTRFTQLGLKHVRSEILVQAIQTLGDRPLSDKERQKICAYLAKASTNSKDNEKNLSDKVITQTLKDTQYVTSWIARNIQQALIGNNAQIAQGNESA